MTHQCICVASTLHSLTEVLWDDMDQDGNRLMDLYLIDEANEARQLVLRELYDEMKGLHYDQVAEDAREAHGDHLMVYGDYLSEARRFTSALTKIAEMMSGPGRPLWQIGKPVCDGRPYIDHVQKRGFNNERHEIAWGGLPSTTQFFYHGRHGKHGIF